MKKKKNSWGGWRNLTELFFFSYSARACSLRWRKCSAQPVHCRGSALFSAMVDWSVLTQTPEQPWGWVRLHSKQNGVCPFIQSFSWELSRCFLSSAYAKLRSQLSLPTFKGADSFHVRVNLSMEPFGDPPSLAVSCNDIVHVTDTRCNGKYHWRCSLVDPRTAEPLQAGNMPNYNRWAKYSQDISSMIEKCMVIVNRYF